MEQPTNFPDPEERSANGPRARTAAGVGTVQSFVDLEELRRLLGRLATVELLRMMVAEAAT